MSLAVILLVQNTMSEAAFRAWGWRIPFLISILLVGIGLYIRLKITETPVFARALAAGNVSTKLPFADAVRHQWREILLTGGTLTMLFGFFYISVTFLTSYAGSNVERGGVLLLDRPTILVAGIVGGFVFAGSCIVSALLSDRIGRRNVVLYGNLVALVAGPLAFLIMQPGDAPSFFIGLSLLLLVVGIPYGPAAAYLPEIFHTRYRYTGAGMGYNLAGILGGALPLVIAPPIALAYGGIGVGFYLSAIALLSVLCVLALPETRHVDMEEERVPAPA